MSHRLKIAAVLVTTCIAAASEPKPYRAAPEPKEGNEIVFVFVGGTGCAFCNDADVKAAVVKAKNIVAERADALKRPFAAIGVAIDSDFAKGLDYLKPLGPFDEVKLGRGFFNSAVLDLMASGDDALVGIPQVLVYERTVTTKGPKYDVTPPKVIARIPGTGIPLWVQYGAKIDALEKKTPATSP
ncbi:MAG TPA: hypothetical protein VFV19_08640 [Candidatus Polarisedimenticolaceae bacterium]|nr:hypothetical protein [Candidatus Polarisedimenticolaceae bacterium]